MTFTTVAVRIVYGANIYRDTISPFFKVQITHDFHLSCQALSKGPLTTDVKHLKIDAAPGLLRIAPKPPNCKASIKTP